MTTLTSESAASIVTALIGTLPNPEDDEPKGPWGPVIRAAVDRVRIYLGPQPEPWRERISKAATRYYRDGSEPDRIIELNPQPLPPRHAFAKAVAEVVIERAVLMQDIADGIHGDEQGIIIIGGYLERFISDYCGNEPRQWKWPQPGPHPNWFSPNRDKSDVLIAAAEFQISSANVTNKKLRSVLTQIAEKLFDAALQL